MNSVHIVGRIAHELEISETPSGEKRLRFNVAVQRTEEKADFIPCTAWRNTADFIGRYFHKGDFIGITGAIEVNPYEKNGERRTDVCVNVRHAEFTQNKQAGNQTEKKAPTLQAIDDDSDIPF